MQVYFNIDCRKRMEEINNAVKVLCARKEELEDRLEKGDLSAKEYLEIAYELCCSANQARAYKEEVDELMKIEFLKLKKYYEES